MNKQSKKQTISFAAHVRNALTDGKDGLILGLKETDDLREAMGLPRRWEGLVGKDAEQRRVTV